MHCRHLGVLCIVTLTMLVNIVSVLSPQLLVWRVATLFPAIRRNAGKVLSCTLKVSLITRQCDLIMSFNEFFIVSGIELAPWNIPRVTWPPGISLGSPGPLGYP